MSRSSDRVNDIIVKLKSEVPSVKLAEHTPYIPKMADDLLKEQVFAYYASDRKRTIFNTATCICIELNEVKFFPMLARGFKRLQDSNTPVTDLIEYQKLYPFMLFINGRFIPLEYINLIASYGKYYFFIRGMEDMDFVRKVRTIESMKLVVLPSNAVYSIGVNADNEYTTLFSFDANGLYNEDEWTHAIYTPDENIAVTKYYDIPDGRVFSIAADAKYKFFADNFFFWDEEGMYANDISITNSLGDIVKISVPENHTSATVIFIRNTDISETIDNINQVVYSEIKPDLAPVINQNESASQFALDISVPFDLQMDREKVYSVNREEAIKYILSYRTDLFYELYELDLDFFTLPVIYDWFISHTDLDGYLNIPRRSSMGTDYYVIVMVNGELYTHYKHHFYDANRFVCPIASIADTDTIELLFFKNAESYAFATIVNDDDEFLPLNHRYYKDSTMLFCKETTDNYFTFPENGHQHFPVPYTYKEDENGNRKINVDAFYHGKEIIVAPDSTFKYYGFYVDEEEQNYYKVNLGTHFYYCYNYDRYLVFYNGRRLSNDQYRLTIPCRSTTPFNEFEIYLAVPLTYRDRLDIFYLPNNIRDLDLELPVDKDGIISMDKASLEYLMGSRLYTFWINGKKIPIQDMKDIDSLTIQLLKDPKSLKNARITRMGKKNEEVETIFQTIDESLWDKILREHDSTELLLDFTGASVDDTEGDAYKGAVPIVSIMWELIREHYIANGLVDTTGPFVYDYLDQDKTAFDGIDSGDNNIIDAANAERRDNLDIERYYP